VPDPSGKSDGPSGLRYAGLGVQLAVSIVVFLYLGQWADRKLGTGSLLTIVGVFVGFGGTMWSLIRDLNRKDRR
jgi:hypothetical protein